MHLTRRFFGFLFAKPLTPLEQQEVREILKPELARAFFAQRPEDQRHALDVQRRVGRTRNLAEAALLHDVGKTDSNLGALSRALATVWGGFDLPTSGAWSSYLNHGPLGAERLEALGATDLAIVFAQSHPGPTPKGVDPDQWQLLEDADNT